MKSEVVNKSSKIFISFAFVLFLLLGGADANADNSDDMLKPIKPLLGEWKGSGDDSRVTHSYELVLQGNFIHSRTRAEFKPKEGEETGEIHEDWGFFSYDPDSETIRFRQFLTEGFVNTYVMEPVAHSGDKLVFTSIDTEGAKGMRARLTIRFDGADRYEMWLELAPPGKEFARCQSIKMERVE
jgi:hypothetical protein